MEEKKFVTFKKEELGVREYIKNSLGKGKISEVVVEYTPIGEKIKVFTSRPGLVIGRKGERIAELTSVLKRRFKLENPHIEICEITNPILDAHLVADEIALLLERQGSLKFKVVAYKMLQQIIRAGAIGAEIVLAGKLPSDRARSWRFSQGYLKKTGDMVKLVDSAQAQATTMLGVIGIKVSILRPDTVLHDKIEITPEILAQIKLNVSSSNLKEQEKLENQKEKSEKKEKTEKAKEKSSNKTKSKEKK